RYASGKCAREDRFFATATAVVEELLDRYHADANFHRQEKPEDFGTGRAPAGDTDRHRRRNGLLQFGVRARQREGAAEGARAGGSIGGGKQETRRGGRLGAAR